MPCCQFESQSFPVVCVLGVMFIPSECLNVKHRAKFGTTSILLQNVAQFQIIYIFWQ